MKNKSGSKQKAQPTKALKKKKKRSKKEKDYTKISWDKLVEEACEEFEFIDQFNEIDQDALNIRYKKSA